MEKLQTILHKAFNLALVVKAFNGIWETITGIVLLTQTTASIENIFYTIAKIELLEDKRDPFFGYLLEQLHTLSLNSKTLIGAYVLAHGIMNLLFVYLLFLRKQWAYPFYISVLCMLVVYQLFRITQTHSLLLVYITLFDMAFIYLAWKEYLHHKKQ